MQAFLSLVGTLGVGGLVGAGLTIFWQGQRDRRKDKKELSGLSRLVTFEISVNRHLLDILTGKSFTDENTQGFQTEAWESSRVRLAQLLPGADLEETASYYAELQISVRKFREHLRRQRYEEIIGHYEVYSIPNRLIDLGEQVSATLSKHQKETEPPTHSRR